jgi:hypothetical protein
MTNPLICGVLSPSTDRPCLKPDSHRRTEERPVHQNGSLTWSLPLPEELRMRGHTPTYEVQDEAFTHLRGLQDTTVSFKGVFDSAAMKDNFAKLFRDVPPSYKVVSFSTGIPEPTPGERLAAWWREQAEYEIEQTVSKAVEYGSTDLIDIGRSLARICDREVDDEEAAEMGVFFYLEGKFARWRSALQRGQRPSDDTLLDIGVYVRMAQRIREAGGWPGVGE